MAQVYGAETAISWAVFSDFIEAADLTSTEGGIARHLYEEHVAALRAGEETATRLRHWLYSHTSSISQSIVAREFVSQVHAELSATEGRWRESSRKLVSDFFADLRAALPEQPEAIDRFERADRRQRLMVPGRLSRDGPYTGAAFDVIAFARQHLDQELNDPEIRETLDRYELEVDGLLRRFEERNTTPSRRRELMTEAQARVQAGEDATRLIREIADYMGEPGYLMVLLFRANEAASLRIASLLEDEELRERFRLEPRKRLLAWMYESVATDAYLERALRSNTLTESQRASLEGLRAEAERLKASREPQLELLHKKAMTDDAYEEYYIRAVRQGLGLEEGGQRLNDTSIELYAGRDELVAKMNDILARARQIMGEESPANSNPGSQQPGGGR